MKTFDFDASVTLTFRHVVTKKQDFLICYLICLLWSSADESQTHKEIRKINGTTQYY